MQKFLIAALFVAGCGPLSLTLLGVESADIDNSNPPELPGFSVESFLDQSYFQALGDYLIKTNPIRPSAVALNASLSYQLFRDSPNPDVGIGGDGWAYFYHSYRMDCEGIPPYEKSASNLKRIGDVMSDHGKRFYFAIAPNKRSIYPEHQSEVIRMLGHCADEDSRRFRELVEDELGDHYVDLFDLLRREKQSGELLYSRLDTHWTTWGSRFFVENIVNRIDPDYLVDTDLVLERVSEEQGELARMMALPLIDTRNVFDYRRPGVSQIGNFRVSHSGTGRDYNYFVSQSEEDNLYRGKVLVVHDSFIYYTWSHFSRFFQNTLYVHWSAFTPESVAQLMAAADVVIIETVERETRDRSGDLGSDAWFEQLLEALAKDPSPEYWESIEERALAQRTE